MAVKRAGASCWFLGASLFLGAYLVTLISGGVSAPGSFWSSCFVFDYVSFYLSLTSLFLLVSLSGWWGALSRSCRLMLLVSIFMSFLCYCSSNALVFWASYEFCILPLLFLLVSESSYSERFVAFWYLGGYVVLTSLPLLLCIFYLFGVWGGFSLCLSVDSPHSWVALFVLCVCFITKIPLPPFHIWLPIVHAEASSPVSVCLSGFIMKLGLLGVFRFSYLALPYSVFSPFYVVVILFMSIGFFMLCSQELDGKRWLAILSLSHIVVAAVGLMVCGAASRFVPFVFCLGHGLSAGLVFVLLWGLYNSVGSRNWGLLKFGAGDSVLGRLAVSASLCSAGSIPPTLSFFSEVRVFIESGSFSLVMLVGLLCYLFFGGLVPVFVLGTALSRHISVCSGAGGVYAGSAGLVFLVCACFFSFLAV